MPFLNFRLLLFLSILTAVACSPKETSRSISPSAEMMVRIAEIEIHPEYLEAYKAILEDEAEASLRLEEEVIAIFPMFQRENPSSVRILEIYQDKEAYEAHLQTPHFLHYKNNTLHMVKSLNLVEMEALDKDSMALIFEKLSKPN
ncbi:MAG: antibiotic biosynthesis monooxygenase [Cyclobacteriaceae bacterium]|nr:antibiotic biosynthesis monooxygenase [Cyclobacteriaceae bacterium]